MMLSQRTRRNAFTLGLIAIAAAIVGAAVGELPYSLLQGRSYRLISPELGAAGQSSMVVVGLLVLLVIAIALMGTLIRGLDERHYGPRGAAGWAAVGFLFGAISQISRLVLPTQETGGLSLIKDLFFGLLAVVIYLLVFRVFLRPGRTGIDPPGSPS